MNEKDNFQNSTLPGENSDTEPSLAERARTLMHVGGYSTLSTMSQKHHGYPFGSVMPYAVDGSGSPIFLISQMAMHSKNLRAEPRATLLVAEPSGSLGGARISVMGDVAKVEDDGLQEVAETYLSRHPESKQWAGFGDFGFFKMTVKDVYFIGGFGVMGWVQADDYIAAEIREELLKDTRGNG
jgi:putative heme iron utilization protein